MMFMAYGVMMMITLLIIGLIIWPICIHLTLKNFKKKLRINHKIWIMIIPYIGLLFCQFEQVYNPMFAIGISIIGICFVIAIISIPINILYYIYRKID